MKKSQYKRILITLYNHFKKLYFTKLAEYYKKTLLKA